MNAACMAGHRRNSGLECFPECGNSQELPRPIPLSEIDVAIVDEYRAILERMNWLFSGTHRASTLQENRGRLSALVTDIKKGLGISKGGNHADNLVTYGDLRRTGKKVQKIIMQCKHRKFKDRSLDPTVGRLAQDACQRISERYVMEIARLGGRTQPVHTDIEPSGVVEVKVSAAGVTIRGDESATQLPAEKKLPRPKRVPAKRAIVEHDEDELPALEPVGGEVAMMEPKEILRYLDGVAQESWGDEREERAIVEKLGIPWGTFRLWKQDHDRYEVADCVLAELRDTGKVTVSRQRKINREAWDIVFSSIRRDTEEEIKGGNSVFGPDETEVAFACQLREYKLLAKYCEMRGSAVTTGTSANDRQTKEEQHPSTVGFSAEEIAMISREDRERLVALFGRLPMRGNAERLWGDMSRDEASGLCDIVRILLTYQETLGEQFTKRLGLSSERVWNVMRVHGLKLLNDQELAALRALEKELDAMNALKHRDPDGFEERKLDMMGRMVVYRRLLRMEHADDFQRRICTMAEVLGVSSRELSSWEWKIYPGLTNHELAPDLFPEPDAEHEDDSNAASSETSHAGTVPTGTKSPGTGKYGNIVEAIRAGELDYEMPEVSPDDYESTDSLPGTREKLEVVRRRVASGLPLSHPRDRKCYSDGE